MSKKERKEFSKEHSNTLCWMCSRAIGKCSWSAYFRPVKGWVAKEVIKTNTTSYIVEECPLFQRDATEYGLRRLSSEKEDTYNNTNYYNYCD